MWTEIGIISSLIVNKRKVIKGKLKINKLDLLVVCVLLFWFSLSQVRISEDNFDGFESVCVCVLLVCVCLYIFAAQRPEEGLGSLGIGVRDSCLPVMWAWESNPNSLTSEPSLRPCLESFNTFVLIWKLVVCSFFLFSSRHGAYFSSCQWRRLRQVI